MVLDIHIRNAHTEVEDVNCEVCNAVLKSCSLKEHMKTVHGEKIYQCEHCLKHYATTVKLNWHLKTVHGPKLLGCEVCGQKYSTLGKMNAHKKTHLEVKNFIDLYYLGAFSTVFVSVRSGVIHLQPNYTITSLYHIAYIQKLKSK